MKVKCSKEMLFKTKGLWNKLNKVKCYVAAFFFVLSLIFVTSKTLSLFFGDYTQVVMRHGGLVVNVAFLETKIFCLITAAFLASNFAAPVKLALASFYN